MEALSTTASFVALIQLIESVRKLYEFWVSIKEAPEHIQSIVIDVKLLADTLADIASEAKHTEASVTLIEAIENCDAKVKALNSIVREIESDFASASITVRRRAALKSVIRGARIKRFTSTLESLKSTLLLVQQCQDRYDLHT